MTSDEVASVQSGQSTALSSTTDVLFGMWERSCLKRRDTSRKDSLRKEARAFFQSLIAGTEIQVGETTLKTKTSHEEALAILLQRLGRAFAASYVSRVCALYAVLGALEGCEKASLSENVIDLLTNFLLVHCAPLVEEEFDQEIDYDGDDYGEQVRDAAILSLTALFDARCTETSSFDFVQYAQKQLRITQDAIRSRCAVADQPDRGDSSGFGHIAGETPQFIQSGLALLTRSRRSLCFDLLRATIQSISDLSSREKDLKGKSNRIESDLVEFAVFVTNCLHGESDPRCLIQMLKLFRTMLTEFRPLFDDKPSFPLGDVFDAIAPYYPIQFTPPPNDVHGITKDGLRRALLDVMCFTGYDKAIILSGKEETMYLLSLSLILEQIHPMADDYQGTDETNMTEKLEALKDLSILLFSRPGENKNGDENISQTNCDMLTPVAMRQLSDSLISVHERTSIEVAKRGREEDQAKEAADLCRSIVARVALESQYSRNKDLWKIFVSDSLGSLSAQALSSPSRSRVAIAYMACLCCSGSAQTLRLGLERGLAPMLRKLAGGDLEATEDISTLLYGVGAFFSACTTTLTKARVDGVALSPHPLADYSSQAILVLSRLVGLSNDRSQLMGFQIRIAAVRGLESVLKASPSASLSKNDVEAIRSVIKYLLSQILLGDDSISEDSEYIHDWLQACSATTGSILSYSLDTNRDESVPIDQATVLDSPSFRLFLTDSILPSLLSSCYAESKDNAFRSDWRTVVAACSLRVAASEKILAAILAAIDKVIRENHDIDSVLKILNIILRKGGPTASEAYHKTVTACSPGFDLVRALISIGRDTLTGSENTQSSLGTSMLKLPPSIQESKALEMTMNRLHDFVDMIRPAYLNGVPRNELEKLIKITSNALPPLEDADSVKLAVVLPLLSAAINSKTIDMDVFSDTEDQSESLLSDLADFVLSNDANALCRSHAAVCLHVLLLIHTPSTGTSDLCPCEKIVTSLVTPSLSSVIRETGSTVRRGRLAPEDKAAVLTNAFSLLSVVGSAAASRGLGSKKTADEIIHFFVDFACSGKSVLSSEGGNVVDIDISGLSSSLGESSIRNIRMTAANSLGSLLSVDSMTSLTKQRLSMIAGYRLKEWEDKATASVAQIAVSSNIVCTSTLRIVDDATVRILAEAVMKGYAPSSTSAGAGLSNFGPVRRLLLAATLKLLTRIPDIFSRNVSYIVVGVMRTFAVGGDENSTPDVVVKLLGLQILESIPRLNGARDELLALKPVVLSILAFAMNHPSTLLRQAAVEVRNMWCVLGDT